MKILNYIRENKVIILTLFAIALLKIFVLREIGDKDFEPDGYNHVLYANTLFVNFPKNIDWGLSIWAKPLYTYVFGFFAHLVNIHTLDFYQISNIFIWAGICLLVYEIVKNTNKGKLIAILVSLMCCVSFLAFRSSITALTEPIFALVLVSTIFFLQRKQYLWSTIIMSFAPLGRMEGFLFLIVYGLFLVYKLYRKELSIKFFILLTVICALPTIGWDLLGWLNTGEPLYLIKRNYPSVPGLYGYGKWSHYIRGFLKQDIILTIMFVIGMVGIIKLIIQKKLFSLEYFVLISFIMFSGINIYLWKYGLYGTAGLMRYFVPIVPFMCILAGWGLNSLYYSKFDKKFIRRFAIPVIILCQIILTLFMMYAKEFFSLQVTYPFVPDARIEAGQWILDHKIKCNVKAPEPEILYYAKKIYTNSTIYIDTIDNEPLDAVFILPISWLRDKDFSPILNDSTYLIHLRDFGDEQIIMRDSKKDDGNCNIDAYELSKYPMLDQSKFKTKQ
jgi:hypothetical protein